LADLKRNLEDRGIEFIDDEIRVGATLLKNKDN
jgi:hypothetical protein